MNSSQENLFDSSSENLNERLPIIVPVDPRTNDGKGVDCYLDSISQGKSPNKGVDTLEFLFVQKDEGGSNIKEGKIIFYDPFNPEETDRDKLVSNINATVGQIKHIGHGFIGKDGNKVLAFKAANFKQWCDQFIQKVGDSYRGVKANVKFVYNGEYLSIPRYPTFISTEKRNVLPFEVSPKYDKFVKPGDESAIDSAPGASDAQGTF